MRSGLYIAAAVALALWPAPGISQDRGDQHAFSGMAGSWSGGGTVTLSSGGQERLRCRAQYGVGGGGRTLELRVRCASDSYHIDLSGQMESRRGRVEGSWSESANGFSGSLSGTASGGNIRAVATSANFTAGLGINTRGGSQTISIIPRAAAITEIQVALRRGG